MRSSSNIVLDHTMPKFQKPKKTVRFCDNATLENVRLFLKTQMPKACRSDPVYPKQYFYSLRRSNWPTERRSLFGSAVRFECIQLESEIPQDNAITLTGTCQVANISFEKRVTIRYTLDDWKTVEEIDAAYQEPVASSANTWDRFSFKIKLNASQYIHETLHVAIKYITNGKEFWDNNHDKNYKLDLIPEVQLEIPSSDELSSSSDEEDDENVFEDCHDQDEDIDFEEEAAAIAEVKEIGTPIKRFEPLSLVTSNFMNNNIDSNKRLSDRYDFDTAKVTPWSPPLSPTTPADCAPLWVSDITSSTTNNHSTPYFLTGAQAKPPSPELSPTSEFKSFQDLIQNYCFYSNHSHDPIRPSSPRAIKG
jgi:hypothetical protein